MFSNFARPANSVMIGRVSRSQLANTRPALIGWSGLIAERRTVRCLMALALTAMRSEMMISPDCGKAALDDIEVRCAPVATGTRVDAEVLVSLPDRLREKQRVFDRTGGLHAAGLFDVEGGSSRLREDVGRHNAVDKVVGEQLLAGAIPLADHVLQVSGRASFEIVQKAAVAGIPVVSAVSAPSSLSVEAAERFGMTLVGFVRDGGCNVYSHPERVV